MGLVLASFPNSVWERTAPGLVPKLRLGTHCWRNSVSLGVRHFDAVLKTGVSRTARSQTEFGNERSRPSAGHHFCLTPLKGCPTTASHASSWSSRLRSSPQAGLLAFLSAAGV